MPWAAAARSEKDYWIPVIAQCDTAASAAEHSVYRPTTAPPLLLLLLLLPPPLLLRWGASSCFASGVSLFAVRSRVRGTPRGVAIMRCSDDTQLQRVCEGQETVRRDATGAHLFPMRFQERSSVCREREREQDAAADDEDDGASSQKQAAMLSRPSAPMAFLPSSST